MGIETAIDGLKTREEELEELLAPDGVLNREIFETLQGVVEAERDSDYPDYGLSETSDKAYEAFDNALNRYLEYAIEYDRLKR